MRCCLLPVRGPLVSPAAHQTNSSDGETHNTHTVASVLSSVLLFSHLETHTYTCLLAGLPLSVLIAILIVDHIIRVHVCRHGSMWMKPLGRRSLTKHSRVWMATRLRRAVCQSCSFSVNECIRLWHMLTVTRRLSAEVEAAAFL